MITPLLHLLRLLPFLFGGHRQLALENLALRHQIAVYKRTVTRPRLCRTDRFFWVTLARVWAGWRQPLAIVTPDTVLRWQRRRFREHWTRLSGDPPEGARPSTPSSKVLVMRMAANLLWGAPRIHGELLKLDLDGAERTVSRLMPKRRLPPSQTWRTFLANHVRNLVLIDFLVVPSAPLRVLFVLVVLAHHRRPVPIASGRTGSRLVMTRCTRTLQRTTGRPLGTRRTDGGAVGRQPLDGAALSDMSKDRVHIG